MHAITLIAFIVAAVVLGSAFPAHAQSADDSLLRLRDTNATKSTLQSKVDSLNAVPSPAGGDTAHKPLSAFASAFSPPGAEDTTYCFWLHPYWGIGAGWGLGSFPLFSEWQNGLPDSSAQLVGPGSKVSRFTVREPVNSYNIFWPLFLSYTPFINERHALSLESSFYFIFTSKSYKVSLTAPSDSANTTVEWSQSCAASFFTVGFDYRRSIPEEYFKVENVKRTTGNIGLSLIPLVHFTKSASFTSANVPDSTVAILNGNKDNRTFNGLGLSWKVGVSCLKKLSSKSGLEIGISYMGRYLGYFKNGSTWMLWKDVNSASSRPNGKVSLASHTVELSFMLQNGKAAPAKKK